VLLHVVRSASRWLAWPVMLLVMIGFHHASMASDGDTPLSAPPPEIIATETQLIRDALPRQYTRAAEENDSVPLIVTLLKLASLSDSGTRKYALMLEAERLAMDARLFGVALRTAEERGKAFKVAPWDARLAIIDAMAKSPALEQLEQGITLADLCLRMAIATEAFTKATECHARLKSMIDDYGKREKIREGRVRASLIEYSKEHKRRNPKVKPPNAAVLTKQLLVHQRKSEYDELLAEASRELDDATSRRGVSAVGGRSGSTGSAGSSPGLRLCLDRYEWEQGLPLMASGSDAIAAAAKRELEKGSMLSDGDRIDVANIWWNASSALLGGMPANLSDVASIRSHAAELYMKALSGVSDPLVQNLAKERIQSVAAPRIIMDIARAADNTDSTAMALIAYEMYLTRPDLTEPQRQAARVQLESWKLRAAAGCVRHGDVWLPATVVDEKVSKAAARLSHGIHLLAENQPELAKDEMDAASQLDPANAIPESVIAWVYCFIFDHDLLAAEHYLEASRRQPTNGLVLVNLANCELISGRHEDALVHYQRALDSLPDAIVANNVGWAVTHSRELKLGKSVLQDFNRLYRRALIDVGIKRTDNEDLFFVKPYVVPDGDSSKTTDSRTETKPTIEAAGSGTGFIVAPGYIVTNHHVVDGATEISITDPANPDKRHAATVVASAGGHASGDDLALLKCNGLPSGGGIPLAGQVAPRGEDVMALGFPNTNVLGKELKSTRGAVVSAVDESGLFYLDCIINPGNSGGPIVDECGRVIGAVVAITRKELLGGNTYSLGIPVEKIRTFLEKHLPEDVRAHVTDNAKQASQEPLKWTEVDARVSKSTIFIQTIIRRGGDKEAPAATNAP
jgi:S1-C subfamily serine protease